MIPALIFVLSAAALVQFAIFYYRGLLVAVASEPLSAELRQAAGIAGETAGAGDFAAVFGLHQMCPELGRKGSGVGMVRAYYRLIATLGNLCGNRLPALSEWAGREMAICSRYVAVVVDQRFQHTLACRAQIRSY